MKKFIIGLTIFGALAVSSCNTLEVAPPNSISDVQIRKLLASGDAQKVNDILAAIAVTPSYFNVYGTYTGYSSYPLNYQVDHEFIFNMIGNDAVLGTQEAALKGGHMTYYDMTSSVWRMKDQSGPFWDMPVDFYIAANKSLNFITPAVVTENPSLGKGRADGLVVRSWGYLNLVERFCPAYAQDNNAFGLPIYTEYRINHVAKISPAKDVYTNIISWLKEAIELYKSDGVKVGYTADVEDIDLGVAQFLLMKAATEYCDWATVISVGEELTSAYPNLIPVANYGAKNADLDAYVNKTKDFNAKDNAFLCAAANPETILAAKYGGLYNKALTWSLCNTLAGGEAGEGKSAPRIDDRLLAKIAANDVRKDIFTDHDVVYPYITDSEGTINNVKLPKQATLKWGATQALTETARSEKSYADNILMRSSEAYLMLAEAYANSGQDSKATAILDKILAARATSGTLTCANSMSGMSALDMVKLQWRIEMWMEKGLEFFNNRRWGVEVDRSSSATHYSGTKKLAVKDMIVEVPKDEQTANTNWSTVY